MLLSSIIYIYKERKKERKKEREREREREWVSEKMCMSVWKKDSTWSSEKMVTDTRPLFRQDYILQKCLQLTGGNDKRQIILWSSSQKLPSWRQKRVCHFYNFRMLSFTGIGSADKDNDMLIIMDYLLLRYSAPKIYYSFVYERIFLSLCESVAHNYLNEQKICSRCVAY